MKHFDLFSGYGGFTLAAEKAYENYSKRQPVSEKSEQEECSQGGVWTANEFDQMLRPTDRTTPLCNRIETIGFSEIDKYPSAVLKYHYPNIKNYGDIKKINWAEVPDFDLLTGGSPCQDLSIAGKRAGLEGERSGLFYEYLRAVKEKRPKYFIWENVKGALSSNKGWDFAAVINSFSEAGYSLWWQVLNAKDFGVPQNRERIFVIGFRDQPAPEIFFEREGNKQDTRTMGKEVSYTIDANYAKGTNTLEKSRRQVIRQPLKFLDRNQKNIEGDYAFTVDSMNTGGVKIDSRIRRLTPTECERLMGLPDGWTEFGADFVTGEDGKLYLKRKDISDSQRYKLCGNGVVVNAVEEIIKELIYAN